MQFEHISINRGGGHFHNQYVPVGQDVGLLVSGGLLSDRWLNEIGLSSSLPPPFQPCLVRAPLLSLHQPTLLGLRGGKCPFAYLVFFTLLGYSRL